MGTANQRLIEFFRYEVVADAGKPIVIIIDEIDSTLKLPYTDDFFVAIRGMYNDRSRDPAFERISFCMVGVATPNELIKDRRTTPYNVGRTIEFGDFDPAHDDLGPLCRAVASDPQVGECWWGAVIHWTGGHPYLTQRLCEEITRLPKTTPKEIESLVSALVSRLARGEVRRPLRHHPAVCPGAQLVIASVRCLFIVVYTAVIVSPIEPLMHILP